jgi:transcription elongation GreA/GreB family factor
VLTSGGAHHTVAIRLEDGIDESHVVVHSAEASLDDRWISVESLLGRTPLGRRVGETVEVSVPTGSYRFTNLSTTRARCSGGQPI